MRNENLFTEYAIGGAIASLFYVEPVVTFDLDIFVLLPENKTSPIITLTPIYDWLKQKGFMPYQEQVMIEGIPVQFIPVYNELINDAVEYADIKYYRSVKTRVISAEYLMAIMLQTYRQKDKERLRLFIQNRVFTIGKLNGIMEKFNLKNRFDEINKEIL